MDIKKCMYGKVKGNIRKYSSQCLWHNTQTKWGTVLENLRQSKLATIREKNVAHKKYFINIKHQSNKSLCHTGMNSIG